MISFSIIVVTLNAQKDFSKTLKNIIKQNYKNYEILVN